MVIIIELWQTWPFLDFIGLAKIFHLSFSVCYYGKTQKDFLANPTLFLRYNSHPRLPPHHWTRNAFLTPRVTSLKRDSLPSASAEQIPYHVSPLCFIYFLRSIGGSGSKESTCSVRDLGLIPALGRSSGAGNGNLLQYSCLGNPTGRGAWWATIHGVAKSWTQLERRSTLNALHKKFSQSSSSETSERASVSWDTLFSIFRLGS